MANRSRRPTGRPRRKIDGELDLFLVGSITIVIGLANTLRLSITGIVLATIFGTLIGVARLSKNFLVRSAARAYVEFVRNIPLVVLLVLIYLGVVQNAFPRPNESWVLGPIAVINVRGANAIWYEGANWRAAMSSTGQAVPT